MTVGEWRAVLKSPEKRGWAPASARSGPCRRFPRCPVQVIGENLKRPHHHHHQNHCLCRGQRTGTGYSTMLLSLGAIFFSLVSLFCAVQAKSSTGNSVLVVLQPSLKRDNFTIFFDNLESELKLLIIGVTSTHRVFRTRL